MTLIKNTDPIAPEKTAVATLLRVNQAREKRLARQGSARRLVTQAKLAVSESIDRGKAPRKTIAVQSDNHNVHQPGPIIGTFKTFISLYPDQILKNRAHRYVEKGKSFKQYITRQMTHEDNIHRSMLRYMGTSDKDELLALGNKPSPTSLEFRTHLSVQIRNAFPHVSSCLCVGPRGMPELDYIQNNVINMQSNNENMHPRPIRPVMGIELFTSNPEAIRGGDAHDVTSTYDPDAGEIFDIAFSSHSLEHLYNPFAHFYSIRQVCKYGGYYILPLLGEQNGGPTPGHPLYMHFAANRESFGVESVQEFLDEVCPGATCITAHISRGPHVYRDHRELFDHGVSEFKGFNVGDHPSQRDVPKWYIPDKHLELHFAVKWD